MVEEALTQMRIAELADCRQRRLDVLLSTRKPSARHARVVSLDRRRTMRMSSKGIENLLKKANHDAAESSEVSELSSELSQKAVLLCGAAGEKFDDSWRALRSLKLISFLRLQYQGERLLVQVRQSIRESGKLLKRAESALNSATALEARLNRELDNDSS